MSPDLEQHLAAVRFGLHMLALSAVAAAASAFVAGYCWGWTRGNKAACHPAR